MIIVLVVSFGSFDKSWTLIMLYQLIHTYSNNKKKYSWIQEMYHLVNIVIELLFVLLLTNFQMEEQSLSETQFKTCHIY